MSAVRRSLWLLAAAVLGIALFLPCIDHDWGDFARGFRVRGYQCAVGVALAPLAVPMATPLWLALLAGNVWILVAAGCAIAGAAAPRLITLTRLAAPVFVLAVATLALAHRELGVTALHAGYWVWAASHVLLCAGAWIAPARARG